MVCRSSGGNLKKIQHETNLNAFQVDIPTPAENIFKAVEDTKPEETQVRPPISK